MIDERRTRTNNRQWLDRTFLSVLCWKHVRHSFRTNLASERLCLHYGSVSAGGCVLGGPVAVEPDPDLAVV